MQCENRGVVARKGDTSEYVNKCKHEVFQVLAEARSLEELRLIEPKAREVYGRYFEELENADLKDLATPLRRLSRLNYSRRCAEASAVQSHMNQGLPLASGMEIGYVIRDARKWEVDPERTASKFDAAYHRGLLEKAWAKAAFVFEISGNYSTHPASPTSARVRSYAKVFLASLSTSP